MSIWTVLMIIAIIIFVVIPSFKDRIIPVKKLIITPVVFMFLFYQTISENFISNYGIIALGLLTGITIGILVRRSTVIKSYAAQSTIWIPGSYLSLVIFSLIFSIHFVIGFLQSVNPGSLSHTSWYELTLLFLMSCVSSITIGSNATLYYKYLTDRVYHN